MPTTRFLATAHVVALCLAPCAVQADDTSPVQSETLLNTGASWDGAEYGHYPAGKPELSVLRITIAPHAALAWHAHPMPNAAVVLSGTLHLQKQATGEQKTVTRGQAFGELAGATHRGIAGNEPVELLVFYAGRPGMPLSLPRSVSGGQPEPSAGVAQ
ncbi:cupin domain-containing protein [Paludibacterium paludis]|uniref:Cupin type-2 domain-containing protein n=1 Tax=Paludibacterium paludis TaxID=1225769 RepID=A0A918U9Z9_9NEIS|nr:cupin domain-containing protein [Paludibacterium paludis]GGY14314.1 hypothetical protein GCM10011289_16960 [Paludibacterium paludis]